MTNHNKNPGALFRIWRMGGKYRYGLLLLVTLRLVMSLSGIASPIVFKQLLDGASVSNSGIFLRNFLLLAGIFAVQTLVDIVGFHFQERIAFRLKEKVRHELYQSLLHTQYASFEKYSQGELNNLLNDDVSIAVNGILNIFPQSLSLSIRTIGAAIVLFTWDRQFLILFALLLAVTACGAVLVYKPMRALHKQVRQAHDALLNVQQETLRHPMLIRTFSAYDTIVGAWSGKMELLRKAVYRKNIFSNLLHTGYGLISDLGYLFCLLWYGFKIVRGQVSYGTLAGALQLVGQLQSPLSNVSHLFSNYCASCVSAQRLIKLHALPKEDLVGDQPPVAPEDFREIRFGAVSFNYGQQPVLQNISLTILRGDVIAFVGPSGIGKTTLFKLLLGLYPPNDGTIQVIDQMGKTFPLSPQTRNLFAYVLQGNPVLSGTVYQIVSFQFDKDDFTEQQQREIHNACMIACADEFIQALPQLYQTRIGESGIGLSEGQLQRLAIARAIYYRQPILLLDEATSALDPETQNRLLDNIRHLKDRTVLMITHDQQVSQFADRIVSIENGQLREIG